jgi:hypothetical protein
MTYARPPAVAVSRQMESPRFLQGSLSRMLYPPVILVFLVVGIAELIAWAATTQWWLAAPIVAGK